MPKANIMVGIPFPLYFYVNTKIFAIFYVKISGDMDGINYVSFPFCGIWTRKNSLGNLT